MDKMEQICNTALEMFIADGYSQTPLSRIATAVGLTKAGLYHYFKSKEELLFLLHERQIKKQFLPILEEAEKIRDPEQRIAFFINNYTKHSMAEDASVKILVHEVGNLKPHHKDIIRSVWKRTLDFLRNAIRELEESGRIRKINRTFAAFAALGMCSWTFYWFDYDRKESADELADTYVEIFLKGLMQT
jgi:AcrR family transcriptional regulator